MKIFVCLFLMLMLAGCGEDSYEKVNFESANNLSIQEVSEIPELEVYIPNGCHGWLTEKGMFLEKQYESTTYSILHFFDAETEEIFPLCPKTNCTHDSESCGAYVDAENLHFDGEYLYYVSDDGRGSQIMRQRIDGSDREAMFRQEAGENGLAKIMFARFQDGMVYYSVFGSVFDSETGKITSGEKICIGNLETGEVTVIPVEFGEGNSTTLNLMGVYGNTLAVRRTTGGEEIFGKNNFHETIFLLDAVTFEMTVVAEFDWEDKPIFQMIGENLLYILLDYDPESPVLEHEVWGDVYTDTASHLIVNLETKIGYMHKDAVTSFANVTNEFIFYFEWNAERTECRRMILDLSTGESRPWPETMASLYNLTRRGGYLYGNDRSKDHVRIRILEEDFWAGIPNFYVFPDWA